MKTLHRCRTVNKHERWGFSGARPLPEHDAYKCASFDTGKAGRHAFPFCRRQRAVADCQVGIDLRLASVTYTIAGTGVMLRSTAQDVIFTGGAWSYDMTCFKVRKTP
ncbi:uncharacterized [Tachysurus ichikawai]